MKAKLITISIAAVCLSILGSVIALDGILGYKVSHDPYGTHAAWDHEKYGESPEYSVNPASAEEAEKAWETGPAPAGAASAYETATKLKASGLTVTLDYSCSGSVAEAVNPQEVKEVLVTLKGRYTVRGGSYFLDTVSDPTSLSTC